MRGEDAKSGSLFSYVSSEARVPSDHPGRAIRLLWMRRWKSSRTEFDAPYASVGRPSIPPEKLLRRCCRTRSLASVRNAN